MKTCDCGQTLVLEPVPGAKRYPMRAICPTHGYNFVQPKMTISDLPDAEKPNDYLSELCSPADLILSDGEVDDSRY